MTDFFNFSVWWWVWTPLGLGAAVVAFWVVTRFFGVKAGMITAGVVAALSVIVSSLQRAKQEGYNARKRQEEEETKRVLERVTRARAAADRDGVRGPDKYQRD